MKSNRSATLGDILQRSEVERAGHDIFPSESTWSPWVNVTSGIRALRFSSRGEQTTRLLPSDRTGRATVSTNFDKRRNQTQRPVKT